MRENAYHVPDEGELRGMFEERARREEKEQFDYDRWIQAFCKRKYNSDFSMEMTRSVGEYLDAYERGR